MDIYVVVLMPAGETDPTAAYILRFRDKIHFKWWCDERQEQQVIVEKDVSKERVLELCPSIKPENIADLVLN